MEKKILGNISIGDSVLSIWTLKPNNYSDILVQSSLEDNFFLLRAEICIFSMLKMGMGTNILLSLRKYCKYLEWVQKQCWRSIRSNNLDACKKKNIIKKSFIVLIYWLQDIVTIKVADCTLKGSVTYERQFSNHRLGR